MNSDRWPEVERLYEKVMALPVDRRTAFLAEACLGDDALRREVEGLLNLETAATDFLEQPALRAAVNTLSRALPHLAPPNVPGYEIIRELGEGGMGVVYLAEQRVPLQRTVALKLIRPGMDSRHVLARFERERQALARMDHPNIAAVFDAGSTTDGRPYFVMEFVDGVSITEYCDSRSLSIRARLLLFIQVCNAVQHAHQKGVIHRDLKPSNVMVINQDGQAVPKVIDFGTAKSADRANDATRLTTDGLVFGTVAYMSPEQAALSNDIDTTTDVYSLGVLLYELLVGCTPFDRHKIETDGLEALLRAIRDSDPPRPSSLVSRDRDFLASVAARGTDVAVLARQLSGDLDWIVLKALEKDRRRRYPTAASLGADVQRFLDSKPIEARPPSVSYRIRKFTRRYRGQVAATVGVAATLLLGLVTSTTLYWRAERNRDEAERQRQTATAAADSLRAAMRELEFRNYVATIAVADMDIRSGNLAPTRERLLAIPESQRNWEWWYLFNQTGDDTVFTVASTTPSCMSSQPGAISSDYSSQVLSLEAATGSIVLRRCRAVETWAISGVRLGTFNSPSARNPVRPRKVLAVDPNSKIMVVATSQLMQWSVDLFDPRTQRFVEVARVAEQPDCADIAPDGERIAFGVSLRRTQFGRSRSHSFEVWKKGSGRVARFLPSQVDRDFRSFPGSCHVRFNPGGNLVASSGTTVDVWDAVSGTAHLRDAGRPWAYSQPIAFTRNGKRLAIGRSNGSIDVVALEGKVAAPLTLGDARPEEPMAGGRLNLDLPVVALAFSPDDSRLVSGAGKTATVWDLSLRKRLVQTAHATGVIGVAISADGRFVYSTDVAGQLRSWPIRLRSAVTQSVLTSHSMAGAVVSEGATVIAGTGMDGGLSALQLSDLQRTELRAGAGRVSPNAKIPGIAITNDGTRMYIGEGDDSRSIREVALIDGRTLQIGKTFPTDDPNCRAGRGLANDFGMTLSMDDRYLALARFDCVLILETNTLRRVASRKSQPMFVSSLLFRPNGLLIVAMADVHAGEPSKVQAWDWRTDKTVATIYPRFEGAPQNVLWKLTQSANGQRIGMLSYASGLPATLSIWDGDLKDELGRLQAGNSTAVALSHDGSRAVTVSRDNRAVQLWDTVRSSLVFTLPDTDGHVSGVAFTKSGQVIAGRTSGGVTIWESRQPASR